jgi:Zn-dependent protease with chaperone function
MRTEPAGASARNLRSGAGTKRRAQAAAARTFAAELALGALGAAALVVVLTRLLADWRVAPARASHRISIFGIWVGYPTANLAAVIVLGLALLGLIATVLSVRTAVQEAGGARRLARGLAAARPVPLLDDAGNATGALLIEGRVPEAFCAGLLRPRVYISSAAVRSLDREAVQAVLAHERHHVARRDPLRLAIGRVITRGLFFVPGTGGLPSRQRALAELGADEAVLAGAPGSRPALARAILGFGEAPAASGSSGVDPGRVDQLLGESPDWRLPILVCVAAVAITGLVVALALLAGSVARGAATLAPPFLSSQPCIVVLALIPGVAVLGGVRASRGFRRRSCAAK